MIKIDSKAPLFKLNSTDDDIYSLNYLDVWLYR